MTYILTESEAATVLRTDEDDPNLLDLLPLVDGYINHATGRNWAGDLEIRPEAKAAARMLLVRWHEDPGGMAAGAALGQGLKAALTQLEAIRLYYRTFEGSSTAGYIYLPGVSEGDTVVSVRGVQGASGNQAASFETAISQDNYIQQLGSGLDDKWYEALILPAVYG